MRMLAFAATLAAASAAHASPADIATDAIIHGHVAGLAVAIVEDGKTTLSGGFGKADLDNDVAATDATVFRINSITKAFTATLILQLAERGKLRLDDHLSKYFPEYTHDHDPTLAQLLGHTGGVANYGGPSFHRDIKLDLGAKQWVDSLARDRLFIAAPGTTWSYSNAGYDLLGLVAAKVGGDDYARLVARDILAPAGMTQTALCNTRDVVPHRASSYRWVDGHYVHAESWGTYGDASARLCSSVVDLARFVHALDSGQLVSAKSLARMREQSTVGTSRVDYGLGTRLGHLGSLHVIAYTGDGEDWSSAIYEVPDRKLVVVVLASSEIDGYKAIDVAARIVRARLNLPDRTTDLAVPGTLATALRGHWVGPDRVPAEIVVDGAHVFVKPDGAPAPMRLSYQGGSTFRFGDIELVFEPGKARLFVSSYAGGVFVERNELSAVPPPRP